MVLLTNTSASAGGTTITDATNVGTATTASGTVWCISGNNVGQSRRIITFNSASNIVVTVPFPNAIAVGDTFLQVPWSIEPGVGCGNVQSSTLFTQADQTIAAGTGGVATVTWIEQNGRSDSYVLFQLQDQLYKDATI